MAKKIVVDPKIMLGKPVFEGTRVPIYLVLELLAEGVTAQEIVKQYYVDLTEDDVKEALKYADVTFKEMGHIATTIPESLI